MSEALFTGGRVVTADSGFEAGVVDEGITDLASDGAETGSMMRA